MLPVTRIQPDLRPVTRRDDALPYAVAVLLLPILVLWRHDDPLFSPLWQSDPWFYLGYFRNIVNFKRDLFPDFYYGSRLSWILPGYAAHAAFPPVVANAILHLTVHSVAALSLFSILRLTVGVRSAYLATMVFSLHPWFWCATGWDHVNGAAIAYFLLAMALLTRAALKPVGRATLVLAGIAVAGCLFAHLFMAAFVPLLLVTYLWLKAEWRPARAIRALSATCGWMGVGFAAFTILLSGINYFLIDGNPWFWSPSFKTAMRVMEKYTWSESIWSDNQLVPWLWFIIAGAAAAFLIVLSHLMRRTGKVNAASLLFSAQLLFGIGLMAYLQARGVTLLGHYYYACYLLPFVFLVFGASFWRSTDKISSGAYLLVATLATLLCGVMWYDPAKPLVPTWTLPQWQTLLLGGVVLASAWLLRHRILGALLSIAGLAVLTSAVYTGSYRYVDLHATHPEYSRVMDARQHIETRRRGAPILFWYDRGELPACFEYQALNASYMAEFSRINENFPRGCSGPAEPGTLVVVASQKEHSVELAQTALNTCWRPFHERASVESVEVRNSMGGPFTLTMLKVQPTPSNDPPPGEWYKSIPLERVQPGDPKALLRRTSDGLEVVTIKGFGAFAARATLGLDPSLNAKLAVLVRLRVLDGKISVGVLDQPGRSFLVSQPVWPLPWASDVIVPLPSPPATGDLIISNVRPNGQVSKAVVERIEIRKLP